MIDLHMHSLYSDGDKTVQDILKTSEGKKLKYISLTDHNTLEQYKDFALNQHIFSGKMITGLEMDAYFQHKKIEILAYNIKDLNLINQWNEKFFSKERKNFLQEEVRKKLLLACNKTKLIYDKSVIYQEIPENEYISVYIYKELLSHKENIPILGELADNLSTFIRKGLLNPDSSFCVLSSDSEQPTYKEVINIIHQAGGLAFLAHPFEYRFENTIEFINALRLKNELDGIECFHPSATLKQQKHLENYAKSNHLFISGGSDCHGDKTSDRPIGHLNIPQTYIENWVNL